MVEIMDAREDAREEWNDIIKVLKENCQPRNLYPMKTKSNHNQLTCTVTNANIMFSRAKQENNTRRKFEHKKIINGKCKW